MKLASPSLCLYQSPCSIPFSPFLRPSPRGSRSTTRSSFCRCSSVSTFFSAELRWVQAALASPTSAPCPRASQGPLPLRLAGPRARRATSATLPYLTLPHLSPRRAAYSITSSKTCTRVALPVPHTAPRSNAAALAYPKARVHRVYHRSRRLGALAHLLVRPLLCAHRALPHRHRRPEHGGRCTHTRIVEHGLSSPLLSDCLRFMSMSMCVLQV